MTTATTGEPPTAPDEGKARCLAIMPCLIVTDMERSAGHYRRLGFTVKVIGGTFALVRRDGTELHLSLGERHGGGGRPWVFLQVDDADALHREWRDAGIDDLRAPSDAHYGMRDGSHLDPDGNLIMFGSQIDPGSRRA